MITRADYMENRATYEEYYRDVNSAADLRVTDEILDKTESALIRGDEHLNSISLGLWDIWAAPARDALQKAFKERGDFWSMAGAVCALKVAAHDALKARRLKAQA